MGYSFFVKMAKTKKDNLEVSQERKFQVNFSVNESLLEKARDLSYQAGVSMSEIINKGIKLVLEKYEEKNGPISPRPKGNGLDAI